MIRTIRKAKVKDSSVEMVFTEMDKERLASEITGRYSYPPHKDLQECMQNLVKHLVVLCDLKEAEMIDEFEGFDIGSLSQFKITGISIGGEDENEGVVITGMKTLPNGKVLNLNTPFTKFTDEYEPYEYEDYLYDDVAHCLAELREYLNGKRAIVQMDIEFEGVGS